MSYALRYIGSTAAGTLATAGAVHGSINLVVIGVLSVFGVLVTLHPWFGTTSRAVGSKNEGADKVLLTGFGLVTGLFIGAGTLQKTLPALVVGGLLVAGAIFFIHNGTGKQYTR